MTSQGDNVVQQEGLESPTAIRDDSEHPSVPSNDALDTPIARHDNGRPPSERKQTATGSLKRSSESRKQAPRESPASCAPCVCDICHEQESKYKFKCCRWKYCSVECYKRHVNQKAADGEGEATSMKGLESDCQSIQLETLPDSQAVCGGPRHLTADEIQAARCQRRAKRTRDSMVEEDEEEAEEHLTDEQKKRLGECILRVFVGLSMSVFECLSVCVCLDEV